MADKEKTVEDEMKNLPDDCPEEMVEDWMRRFCSPQCHQRSKQDRGLDCEPPDQTGIMRLRFLPLMRD